MPDASFFDAFGRTGVHFSEIILFCLKTMQDAL